MRKYTFTVGDLSDDEDPSWAASVQANSLVEAQHLLIGLLRDMNKGNVQGVVDLHRSPNLDLWARLPQEAILDLDNWECEDGY